MKQNKTKNYPIPNSIKIGYVDYQFDFGVWNANHHN